MNENSVRLFEDFGLRMEDLPENFLEVSLRKTQNNFFESKSDNAINFYNLLSKKYASSSIIHYELITREEIFFAVFNKLFLFKDVFGPDFQFREAKRDDMSSYALIKNQLEYYKKFI